jgi:hypothetical protein
MITEKHNATKLEAYPATNTNGIPFAELLIREEDVKILIAFGIHNIIFAQSPVFHIYTILPRLINVLIEMVMYSRPEWADFTKAFATFIWNIKVYPDGVIVRTNVTIQETK